MIAEVVLTEEHPSVTVVKQGANEDDDETVTLTDESPSVTVVKQESNDE